MMYVADIVASTAGRIVMRLLRTKVRKGRRDEAPVATLAPPLLDVIRFLLVFALSKREAKELTAMKIKIENTGKRVLMAPIEVGNGRKRELDRDHAILL